MKKLVYILLFLPLGLMSQTQTENFVKSTTYKVRTTSTINNPTKEQATTSINYFDGLGRAKQSILLGAGGQGEDIITPFVYDEFGRQTREYLPYARLISSLDLDTNLLPDSNGIIIELNDFYQNKYPEDFNGVSLSNLNSYSEKHLEASPLNRVLEQGAPGKDWALDKTLDTDHTIKFEYDTNTEDDLVRVFSVNAIYNTTTKIYEPTLVDNGDIYPIGELYKTITKDENWQPNQTHPKNHTTEEYKNKQGQVILKRTFDDGKWHDTYYVYDDFGNLTYVLPPKVMTYTSIHQAFKNISYHGEVTTFFNTYNPMDDAGVSIYGNPYNGDENKIIIQFSEDTEDMTPGPLKSGIVADLSDLGVTLPDMELGDVYVKNNGSSVVGGKAKIIGGNIHFTNTNTNIQNDESFYQYFIINLSDHQVNYTSNITQSNLNDLAYQYKYDSRNRLIEKRIPGKDKEYIIYDKLDRPILTQDGEMREEDEWVLTKYDVFGRVAYTTMYKKEWDSREDLQDYIDGQSSPLYETKVTSGSGYKSTYYTNVSAPISSVKEILTINYYDDYSFDMDGLTIPATGTDNTPIVNYNNTDKIKTRGLPTGSKVRVLGTGDWTTTITGYDIKGRAIYTASQNDYLSTTDVITSEVDFIGNTTKTTTTHKKIKSDNSEINISISDNFTYDHANRLISQTQQIGSQSEELIVLNSYDELGQLETKKVGGAVESNVANSTGLQTIDYSYNVRGWLTQINDADNLGNDLFGFGINYNNPEFPNATYATPLYNGNISHTYWKTSSNSNLEQYGYKYDALNRIKDATYAENTSVNNKFNESIEAYDRNGNILALYRLGLYPNLNFAYSMDMLQYSYQGNKLMEVKDSYSSSTSNSMGGFVDGNTSGSDYGYDSNGNMYKDLNKGTSITYNHLNLPTSLNINDGGSNVGTILYMYDTSGGKVQKKVTINGVDTYTEYAGNYIYQKIDDNPEVLQFFNHTEGYITPVNPSNLSLGYNYVYQYKDHLGNVRLSYADNTKTYENILDSDFTDSFDGWKQNGSVNYTLEDGRLKVNVMTSWEGIRHEMQDVEVNQGETYTIKIKFDKGNTQSSVRFYVQEFDANGNHLRWPMMNSNIQTGEYSYTYTVGANAKKIYLRLDKDNNNTSTETQFYVDYVTFTKGELDIIEESNYYPFGLKHKVYDDVIRTDIGNSVAQKFKYNGVEYNESLGLNLYEMDFRSYDPAIGRFNGIDPVTHHSFGTSVAFDNNPVYWADPSGADAANDWWEQNKDAAQKESDEKVKAERKGNAGGSATDSSNGDCCNGFTNALADLEQFNPTSLSGKYDIQRKEVYNYGGDRSGSFMDNFHKFVDFTDNFNPIALAWDTISFTFTGADRRGNKQTVTEATINAVSIVPIFKVGKFAGLGGASNKFITSSFSQKSANYVLNNQSWLNKGNWWRLGPGWNPTIGAKNIRLAWGAHPNHLAKVPKLLQSFNKLLRQFKGGHTHFPNWKP